MNKLLAVAILLLFGSSAFAVDANSDRLRFPKQDWGYIYYLSTQHLEEKDREACKNALFFSVALSSSQEIAERCVPVEVMTTTV